jgi:hypothetical protein
MKSIGKILLAAALLLAAMIGYTRLRAQWDEQDRVARIDRVIEERKAVLAAEIAYRNQFAEKSNLQALQSEREAQARWDSAKDRGKLPGDNTAPGFTPATGSNYNYSQPRINR